MTTVSLQNGLLERYAKASRELDFLLFPSAFGVSERFQKELGLFQLSKTAQTIDSMISEQRDFLIDAVAKEDEDSEEAEVAGGALTDDKRQVFEAGDRVLRRAMDHVTQAMQLIQNSRIYNIATSEEARRLKLQQRRVSAFKVVEKLADLRDKIEKKRANLINRAQKITLSPTFAVRSRSVGSPVTRSRTARSTATSFTRSAVSSVSSFRTRTRSGRTPRRTRSRSLNSLSSRPRSATSVLQPKR